MGSGERAGKRASFNGAGGSSDIEGKAAMGSGERAGKRASFNGAGEGNGSGIAIVVGQALRLPNEYKRGNRSGCPTIKRVDWRQFV